ncbi:Os08g0314200 [Oryza sativa Japonica Group]|uniref:Os08g0314200 protein n=1 Tax=Oryza sativa subsp. japonica TaxID=39947 RepID=C7J676_ORYSJ|nr:Os08g0314200 [Oryza sativa Japonica Group]|eukprot:NP_001175514.1 Os08g0314200 [Oryza sativa Japonica Group]
MLTVEESLVTAGGVEGLVGSPLGLGLGLGLGLPSPFPVSAAGYGVNGRRGGSMSRRESGVVSDGNEIGAPSESAPCPENFPSNGSEWVELLVNEMTTASNMDDAKSRATRVLEAFEKAVVSHVNAQGPHDFQKENAVLKGQMESLTRENTILKRAFAIQHERQDYDAKNQELQDEKQRIAEFQEQVRNLELNNYRLSMLLRQAQQGSSIPGRFNPDVF